MEFSKGFISAIKEFSLLAVFGYLAVVIFNIFVMYNMTSFHVFVLLVSFYIAITCHNKLFDMILLDFYLCEYCEEDYDGWYKPLDKNGHVCIFDKPHEKILEIDWYGHRMKLPIRYCPMCGRCLEEKNVRKNR